MRLGRQGTQPGRQGGWRGWRAHGPRAVSSLLPGLAVGQGAPPAHRAGCGAPCMACIAFFLTCRCPLPSLQLHALPSCFPQVGEVSYSQRNLFGLGQRLVASAKLGQVRGRRLQLARPARHPLAVRRGGAWPCGDAGQHPGLACVGRPAYWLPPFVCPHWPLAPACASPCPTTHPADGRHVPHSAHRPMGPRGCPPHLPHHHSPGGRGRRRLHCTRARHRLHACMQPPCPAVGQQLHGHAMDARCAAAHYHPQRTLAPNPRHGSPAHPPTPRYSRPAPSTVCRLQNDKQSAAPIHGRAQDDVEHADGAAAGCAAAAPAACAASCTAACLLVTSMYGASALAGKPLEPRPYSCHPTLAPQGRRRVCVPQAGQCGVRPAAAAELAGQPGLQVRPRRGSGGAVCLLASSRLLLVSRGQRLHCVGGPATSSNRPSPARHIAIPAAALQSLRRSWQQAHCVDDHGQRLETDM